MVSTPLLCFTDFFICGIPFPEAENALQASNFDDRIHANNMRGGTVRTQDPCKDLFEGWCVNDQCKINVRSKSHQSDRLLSLNDESRGEQPGS